jgi:hypothetical protein
LKIIAFAATLAVLALPVAGCGRSSSSNDSASEADTLTVDNCSLVTDAEATSLVGKEVKHDEDSLLGCGFSAPGQSMSLFTVRAFSGKGAAKDNFGEHSSDTTVHEIAGVGDSAAVLARDQHVNFLVVQKGRRYVQFVTTFVRDIDLGSAKLKEAQDLAIKALGRIGR